MAYLTLDIGTSNIKCALVDQDGTFLDLQKTENHIHTSSKGYVYYQPDLLWKVTKELIEKVAATATAPIEGIGIAGMAESGLLLDYSTLKPISRIMPWHDSTSRAIFPEILKERSAEDLYYQAGIHLNPKVGLAKILWLHKLYPDLPKKAFWLSVPDYICFQLTGERGTDPTLAVRTYAYDIKTRAYDEAFLNKFDLSGEYFPPVFHCTEAVGSVTPSRSKELGLPVVPVCIGGHDDICTAVASAVWEPGNVLNSMGTAEALIGLREELPLTRKDFESGIHYGIYPVPGIQFCIGGVNNSGGSVEWLRELNPFHKLSYSDIDALDDAIDTAPEDLLFFPYLAGRHASAHDSDSLATFYGLSRLHTLVDFYKAISFGVSVEIKMLLNDFGIEPTKIIAVGGGTNNKTWMQIKTNLFDADVYVPTEKEGSLKGAAVAASVMCGHHKDLTAAMKALSPEYSHVYHPEAQHRQAYMDIFNTYQQKHSLIYP